ncbi:uncharacterized protein LOC117901896 [Drosophila subobscura]|uniref:uncharacterized protein LOC117901896 n=1 Tax=Drosophila subobscura TaxID=7241 RepID=UPI00155B1929|nr:uncharacterized protein LOC117901896 [Drosophila subobscura]XP_034668751.1 uncharacterized protein LOC117901896 [Drosophila subobscura]
MPMANGALTATPSVEKLNAKEEVDGNALKVEAVGSTLRKATRIPVPIGRASLSYVNPRKYTSTLKQSRHTLKKKDSAGNCSKDSISLSPGQPNDDSGIGMDNSMAGSVSPVGSCCSDLTEIGKAEQESLRALQQAVAEMEADLNTIESDGETINDSDCDTITAENVDLCRDTPEKEVHNAVIEKVQKLLPEELAPLQELLVSPVEQMVQVNLKELLEDNPQRPQEMLQTLKVFKSENDPELVEECLQNLINGAVHEEEVQAVKLKLHDQLQQLTRAPLGAAKQLQIETLPGIETKEQQFVREHYEKIERLLHSSSPMMAMKAETMEQQGHPQSTSQKLNEIEEDIVAPVEEMLQKTQQDDALLPFMYETDENNDQEGMSQPLEDIMPQKQQDVPLEEKAAEGTPSMAEEIVDFQDQMEAAESDSSAALTTAEAIMDLQEQLLDNTSGDDVETNQSDLELEEDILEQDQIPDLLSCFVVQLPEEDPLVELEQEQHQGQPQTNLNAVEIILEQQEGDLSKAIVGLQEKPQPTSSWLLEEYIQTLDNDKSGEKIKKLVEEIIQLENEQSEERPPTTTQPEQMSLEVESVASPRRLGPLLGISGLRALEGYLDNGILLQLMQQDVAPTDEVPIEQEELEEQDLVDEETNQEKKNKSRFRELLNLLRAYKMPMEFIPFALVGTALCLLIFFRKF